MSKQELTYEQAMQRLEEITESFEQNTLELDQISSRLAEAQKQKLISFCQKRIQQVEQDIQTILKDEQE